ncbi:hypothetical protein CEXT_127551 [Caerostris extrusa]|uniref:Uncharacterized protein n=1 Tax=Caerostris extrusa TaxID=172846 RepID=A0AAV4SBZ8_CAEEX|nr:hypothetical protein CEXT_127551 [Caerostris extrusa]
MPRIPRRQAMSGKNCPVFVCYMEEKSKNSFKPTWYRREDQPDYIIGVELKNLRLSYASWRSFQSPVYVLKVNTN